jgi:nitroreductase
MSSLNQTVIEKLSWRYATKKFDASKKISGLDWNTLEQVMVLSPSSYGLQPYRFVVVENPELRKALRGAAYNQTQITDASHLVVLATLKEITPQVVDHFFERISAVRGVPVDALKDYKGMVQGSVTGLGDRVQAWTQKQAYIVLGNLLTSAALLGIDACPMEGFDAAGFDKILGLDSTSYASVAVAALGYRAADDAYASMKKVRFSAEELIIRK